MKGNRKPRNCSPVKMAENLSSIIFLDVANYFILHKNTRVLKSLPCMFV